MRPHGKYFWIPILPADMRAKMAALPKDKKRWPKDFRERYKALHSDFTAGKNAFRELARRDRDPLMSGSAFKALSYLIDCLNFDTGRCDPSQQTIADEIGKHVSTAERVLKNLQEAGWIVIHRRGRTTTNFYRLGVRQSKIDAITEDSTARRDLRIAARSAARRLESDPAKMTDHSEKHPAKMTDHEPAKMRARDPAILQDKPVKRTREDETVNEKKENNHREGTYTVEVGGTGNQSDRNFYRSNVIDLAAARPTVKRKRASA
jgi:DNA-binding MarR family transcriptional regulator